MKEGKGHGWETTAFIKSEQYRGNIRGDSNIRGALWCCVTSFTPLVSPNPTLCHLGPPTEQGHWLRGKVMQLGVHEAGGGFLGWSETALLGWRGQPLVRSHLSSWWAGTEDIVQNTQWGERLGEHRDCRVRPENKVQLGDSRTQLQMGGRHQDNLLGVWGLLRTAL